MIRNFPKGQAALLSVLFIFVLSFLTVNGISNVTVGNIRTATDIKESIKSYYLAEGFIEDAALRYIDESINEPVDGSFTYDGVDFTRTIAGDGDGPYTVKIESKSGGRHRLIQTDIVQSIETVNFENGLQAGPGGISINNNATVNGNVCSEGNLVGSGTVINGEVNVIRSIFSGEAGNEDELSTLSTKFGNSTTTNDAAQSFTMPLEGNRKLTRVYVYIKRNSTPGDLNLRIVPNKVGLDGPDNRANALTSQVITEASVSTIGGWVEVTLSTPVTLNYGEKYWIVLDRTTTANSSKNWEWFNNSPLTGTGLLMRNWSNNSDPDWIPQYKNFIYKITLSSADEDVLRAEGLVVSSPYNIYADLIVNSSASGVACPSANCHNSQIDSCPGDTLQILPNKSDVIENWISVAESAGLCPEEICDENGDIRLNTGDDPVTLSDMIVPGDIDINGTAQITIDGTVWVQGDFKVGNSGVVTLGPSLLENGGGQILVGSEDGNSGGEVTISNSAFFDGGGTANLLVLSLRVDNNSNRVVIENTGGGDVFFVAPETCIRSSNNTNSKALIAHCLVIQNSATINYESLLGSFFAQTPFTNEIWQVGSWQEVFE